MKVLITYGGTSEKIDSVRYITNFSSGKTGLTIAKELSSIFFVEAIRSQQAPRYRNDSTFFSFDDLYKCMQKKLSQNNYDVVVHAAAVSDYTVGSISDSKGNYINNDNKINSNQHLQIHLKPTFKILSKIKDLSINKKIKVIAFKLTNTKSKEEVQAAIKNVISNGADYVVHNDLKDIDENHHSGTIYDAHFNKINSFSTKNELSFELKNIIKGFL